MATDVAARLVQNRRFARAAKSAVPSGITSDGAVPGHYQRGGRGVMPSAGGIAQRDPKGSALRDGFVATEKWFRRVDELCAPEFQHSLPYSR
jgi:hypothetical protein